MELIKDIGAIKKPKDMNRYGVFKCPICSKHFTVRISSVKSGNTTKCKNCCNYKGSFSVFDIFSYDSITGSISRKITTSSRAKSGDICDRTNSDGYIVVNFNSKIYLGHRLAWLLYYGSIPSNMEVDHINGIRNDNRLLNLRLVTSSGNSRNMKKSKRNKSGTVGVSWCKNKNRWRATIMINKKQTLLGYFHNKDHAIASRKDAELKNGYHENHGRK